MFKSFVAFSIAIGAAASPSSFHPFAHYDTLSILSRPEVLRRLAPSQLLRRTQNEASCPGTPFLWKIVEDATGNHVGFGIGTMHIPPDLAVTDEALVSIVNAVEGEYRDLRYQYY